MNRRRKYTLLTAAGVLLVLLTRVCSSQPPAPPDIKIDAPSPGPILQIFWLKQLGGAKAAPVWTVKEIADPKAQGTHAALVDVATSQPLAPKLMADVVFSATPLLTEFDMKPKSCHAVQNASGQTAIEFELSSNAAATLAAFAHSHTGEHAAIFVNHELLSAPAVDTLYTIGKVQIPGSVNSAKAEELAEALNTNAASNPFVDLWPLKKGSSWSFDMTVTSTDSLAKTTISQVVTVTDTHNTPAGTEATVAYHAGDTLTEIEVLRFNEAGIFRVAGGPTGDNKIEPPMLLVKYPVYIGSHWDWKGSLAVSGQTFTATTKATVVEATHLKLEAGIFNAVRVHLDIFIEQAGQKLDIQNDFWYVPGVGLVQQKAVIGAATIEGKLTKFSPAK